MALNHCSARTMKKPLFEASTTERLFNRDIFWRMP